EGIRNKTTQKFRDKYRKLALLLVDDVQFIAGKDTVQEEFFHTFNAVTASGGQIILTSDQPPAAIPKLEERLKSRFEAGLLVDVAPPDFELRCAIVQIKAKEKNVLLEPRYVNLIAGNIEGARRIEGVLTRLASETKLRGVEVSEEIIANIIGKGIDDENALKKASPSAVIEAVCTYYQIGKRGILGDTRAKVVSHPRHVLMYLMRNELNLPYEEIGKLIGGRDHSTVMHGVDKMTRLASSDVHIREDIMRIKKALL
ncbi:chromosomal replication initiator protein DnaA, partial [Candidatus Microgenomates bacterium]